MMYTRKYTYSFIFVLFLGIALRLFRLGEQSLWLDELFSVLVARQEWQQILRDTMLGDTNPPLFNLFLSIPLRFSSHETAARFIPFLFSVLTLPIFARLAYALFDRRVALVATFLLSLNPMHVLFAQEARMYAQLTFFTLAATYFFWQAWQTDRARYWILFFLAMTLAFYSHSLAFLNLLAIDLFVLTQWQKWRHKWQPLMWSHLGIVVAFLPWLFVLFSQLSRVQSGFWASRPSPLKLLTTPYLLLFGPAVPTWLIPLALFGFLSLFVFALLAAVRAIRARVAVASSLVFVLIVFLGPLVTLYAISFFRSVFVERTLLPASVGLCLLLAWTITHAQPRRLNVAFGAVIGFAMLATLPNYYFNPEVQKPPMREAARTVTAQVEPGDAVVHTSDSSALAFTYYAPQLSNYFLAGDPDYVNETTRGQTGRVVGLEPKTRMDIEAEHARFWLVVALDHNIEYQKAQVEAFEATHTRLKRERVAGIDMLFYVSRP